MDEPEEQEETGGRKMDAELRILGQVKQRSIRMTDRTYASLKACGLIVDGTQLAILKSIAGAASPLSIRELQSMHRMSPNGVMWHLRHLKQKGLVDFEPGKQRTLRPTFGMTKTLGGNA